MNPIFTGIILSVLCTACATPFVARLEPETKEFSYRNGEKLVAQASDEAKVTLSYYDSSPKYVVFHLEVENVGTASFNFDPVSCLLIGDVGGVQQAIDPEVQLLSMDLEAAKERRSIGLLDVTNLALTAAETALVAAEGVTDPVFYSSVAVNAGTQVAFLL